MRIIKFAYPIKLDVLSEFIKRKLNKDILIVMNGEAESIFILVNGQMKISSEKMIVTCGLYSKMINLLKSNLSGLIARDYDSKSRRHGKKSE